MKKLGLGVGGLPKGRSDSPEVVQLTPNPASDRSLQSCCLAGRRPGGGRWRYMEASLLRGHVAHTLDQGCPVAIGLEPQM